MDLPRLNALSKLSTLYSGHSRPEVSLFSIDPSTSQLSNTFREVSHPECQNLASEPIPEGTLQLIRIRCKPPPVGALTTGEVETAKRELGELVEILDGFGFPVFPVLSAREDQRLIMGEHTRSPSSDTAAAANSNPNAIFYTAGSRLCLLWSPSPPSSPSPSTRAVLVTFVSLADEAPLRLHDLLQHLIFPPLLPHFNLTHPFFLALVLVSTIQTQTMMEYTADARLLHSIENQFVTRKSAVRVETMQALRDLGRLSIQDGYIFSVLQKLLEWAEGHDLSLRWTSSKVAAWMALSGEGKKKSEVERPGQLTDHFPSLVKILQRNLELDTAYLSSISASVANQQTALAEIVTMQDGASMKTIAFITLIFLPATFLATMFATPMFEFDENTRKIVQREFWVYWASVGPLTLAVLGAWAAWWWIRGVRRRFDDKNKRKREDLREWAGVVFRQGDWKKREKKNQQEVERDEEGYTKMQGTKRRKFLNQFYGVHGKENGNAGKVGRGSQV